MIARAALLWLLPLAAAAEEVDRLFIATHTVVVTATAQGQRLAVDGRVLLDAPGVRLEEATDVAGVSVLNGWRTGGDCPPAPFVLALPRDGAARLDGPLETCRALRVEFSDDALHVLPMVGEAALWVWTPDGGFAPAP